MSCETATYVFDSRFRERRRLKESFFRALYDELNVASTTEKIDEIDFANGAADEVGRAAGAADERELAHDAADEVEFWDGAAAAAEAAGTSSWLGVDIEREVFSSSCSVSLPLPQCRTSDTRRMMSLLTQSTLSR